MEISVLTLKLIVLLIPGVVGTKIYKRLVVRHKSESDFMFVIVSIMFGMFSYLLLQIVYCITVFINNMFSTVMVYEPLETFASLSNGNEIPYIEVLLASFMSIILGFIVSKIDHTRTINTIAKKYNISNKYGDENLYTYFLNSPDTNWVYIRDYDKNLTYFGIVELFSETNEYKEIVLGEVTVYSYPDNDELYEIAKIYLSLPKDNLVIEHAKLVENE